MNELKKLDESSILQRLSDGEMINVVGGYGIYFVVWCPELPPQTYTKDCFVNTGGCGTYSGCSINGKC